MKIINYIKKLIEKQSNESSKRFIALSITLLIFYATLRFANEKNIVIILSELIGFILVLMGVSVWENIKRKN